jgi:hypothetical protein
MGTDLSVPFFLLKFQKGKRGLSVPGSRCELEAGRRRYEIQASPLRGLLWGAERLWDGIRRNR